MKLRLLYLNIILGLISSTDHTIAALPNRQLLISVNKHIHHFHPVHISYTNIEFNQKANQFEILFKLYVDDFGVILNRKYNQNINLLNDNSTKLCRETIDKYIFEHFKLIINNKDKTKAELKLNKLEIREQAIWLYYNYSFKGNCNTFDIYNSLMNDLYPDQTNLLIFSYHDDQKAFRFTASATNEKLTF